MFNHASHLDTLKGKKFKYDSPHGGLSEWTDTVKHITVLHEIKSEGYKLKFIVYGEKNQGYNHYPLERVVFV